MDEDSSVASNFTEELLVIISGWRPVKSVRCPAVCRPYLDYTIISRACKNVHVRNRMAARDDKKDSSSLCLSYSTYILLYYIYFNWSDMIHKAKAVTFKTDYWVCPFPSATEALLDRLHSNGLFSLRPKQLGWHNRKHWQCLSPIIRHTSTWASAASLLSTNSILLHSLGKEGARKGSLRCSHSGCSVTRLVRFVLSWLDSAQQPTAGHIGPFHFRKIPS